MSWSKAIASKWLKLWMELAVRVGWGRGRALGTGAWQREQVDDGQLKSGERGRGTSILEDSWGSERPWKKRQPHLEAGWGLGRERDLEGGVWHSLFCSSVMQQGWGCSPARGGRGSQTIVLVEELKAFDVERQRERKKRKTWWKRRLPTVNAINSKRKTIFNSPSGCHMLHHCQQSAIEFKDAYVQCTISAANAMDVCTGFIWQSQCGNSLNVIARMMVHYISEPVHSHRYRQLILQNQRNTHFLTNDTKIPSKSAAEKPLKLHNTDLYLFLVIPSISF